MKTTANILEKWKRGTRDIILDGADFISQRGYTLLPNYVLYNKKISPYAKLVYATLLSYAWGDKNKAFPGQETVAESCGVSPRTVEGAIKELKDNKFITVLRRGMGKTNVYILHFKKH